MDSIHVLITTYKVHPYYSATISVVKCIATRCGSRISFVVALLLTFWGSVGHGWRKHSVCTTDSTFLLLFLLFVKTWCTNCGLEHYKPCVIVSVTCRLTEGSWVWLWITQSERCLYKPMVLVFFANQKKSTKMCDHFHEMLFLCNKCFFWHKLHFHIVVGGK